MSLSNATPFIAGNWKMFKTVSEAEEIVKALMGVSADFMEAEVVVIPPFTALSKIRKTLCENPIQLGAQNVYWEEEGAYTGEISPRMLKEVGCQYVVIGHSERRQYFGETNQTVNKKIQAVLKHDMYPIMCIGETLEEREQGKAFNKIGNQIDEGLEGFDAAAFSRIVIAYEPIWAIGTGVTATPGQAQEVHAFIREKLSQKYGNDACACAIILYGGSVKPANTFSLLNEKDINGALVGGAALQPDSFSEIVKEAIKAYKEK